MKFTSAANSCCYPHSCEMKLHSMSGLYSRFIDGYVNRQKAIRSDLHLTISQCGLIDEDVGGV